MGQNASSGYLLSTVLGQWLAECPSDVLGFLEQSPRRDQLLQAAAKEWLRGDAKGISEWLAAAGDFEGRDAIVAGMAVAVAREDGEAAIAWIASIKDPQQKLIAAQDSAYSFYRHSDEAAREAFQKMGLPDSAFDSLLAGSARDIHQHKSYAKAHHLIGVCKSALEAGAEFAPQSASEVFEALSKGISGAGAFSGSMFKLDATDWTPREIEDALNYLQVSDGKVQFKDQ